MLLLWCGSVFGVVAGVLLLGLFGGVVWYGVVFWYCCGSVLLGVFWGGGVLKVGCVFGGFWHRKRP